MPNHEKRCRFPHNSNFKEGFFCAEILPGSPPQKMYHRPLCEHFSRKTNIGERFGWWYQNACGSNGLIQRTKLKKLVKNPLLKVLEGAWGDFFQEVPHKKCTIARCANIFLRKRTLVSILGGGTKTLAGAMA